MLTGPQWQHNPDDSISHEHSLLLSWGLRTRTLTLLVSDCWLESVTLSWKV